MRAYHINEFKSIAGIVLQEHKTPTPRGNEVLIKVKSVSLNRRDWYILQQTYPLPALQGIIPASDGAGEVIAAGEQVKNFRPGDRVAANYFARWRDGRMGMDVVDQLGCTLDGMLAELVILPEECLVPIPGHLSWEEAATLPCSGVTAWNALKGIAPGQTVLTIGSGGVALFAIQFAKLAGVQVIALTSHSEKTDQLLNLGASHVIDYKATPDWHKTVRELTGGRGVDRVVETGGSDTMEQSVLSTTMGGDIIFLSPSATLYTDRKTDANKILVPAFVNLVTIRPQFVGSRLDFETMNAAIAQHRLKPVIDRSFTFEETAAAYNYLITGKQFGKIIINL